MNAKYPGIPTVIHGNGAIAEVMGHVCGGVIGYPISMLATMMLNVLTGGFVMPEVIPSGTYRSILLSLSAILAINIPAAIAVAAFSQVSLNWNAAVQLCAGVSLYASVTAAVVIIFWKNFSFKLWKTSL